MIVDEILKSFKINDGIYKRKEIAAAISLQDEITPHLINILKGVLADPQKYVENDNDYFAHIYAFMLLGYFKESQAHDVIVDLFSLPGDLPSDLFGDCVTGDLSIILLNTCGGDLARVKGLVLNRDAYEYCRSSAITVIMYAVVDGTISHENALSFYGELFNGDEASTDSCFHDALACCVCDLYPEGLMPVIKKAYEDGIIDTRYIAFEEFGEALAEGKEKCLRELEVKFNNKRLLDIHERMSWWANFKQDEKVVKSMSGYHSNSHLKLVASSPDRPVDKAKSKRKW